MKKCIITFCCFFILINATAQDPGYTGPAKVYVKSFWNQIEKLKMAKEVNPQWEICKRSLKSAKEKGSGL
ncbi:MAG: hypothetical protein IPP81_10580 [Chitinophagaceae bacterium]|nr:hypothetical protein [Chitinophagaceae bacterium]